AGSRDSENVEPLFRVDNPPRNHVASHRTIQARPAERNLARVQAEEVRETGQAGYGEPRARHAQVSAVEAVEWKYLVDSPARGVRRFRLKNRRTRILSPDEQRKLLEACCKMPKLRGAAAARADHRRSHRRAPRAALGGLPGRLRDLLADEKRQ